MFFISTQPRFIRGVVLPWVISFLKTNLIMLLRKFYLKIQVGICCSQPHPGDSREWLCCTAAAAQNTWPRLPSLQPRQWRFSLSASTSPRPLESSQRHQDICQTHWEVLYSGLMSEFMERRHISGVLYPKDLHPWCYKSVILFIM